jgi:GxxExxY protein
MNTDDNLLTQKILGCAIKVSNKLGIGFLEKIYENALAIELRRLNLKVEQQCNLKVFYDKIVIGDYCADLIVNSSVIVELKSSKVIDKIHEAQILNYLRASKLRVGLLLNFGTPRLGIRRFII